MKSIMLLFTLLLLLNPVFGGSTEDLIDALKQHDGAKARSAIAAGADVNGKDKQKNPAISSAVFSAEMMKIMVDAGADVNARDAIGYTPLMSAASLGMAEVMQVLIDAKADIRAKTKEGMPVLHLVTWRSNCARCAEILIKAGADPNEKDANGETPLTIMMTAMTAQKRVSTVAYTGNAYKAAGYTALPRKFTSPTLDDFDEPAEIMDILLKNNSDPNAANAVGTTPLITASFLNNAAAMKSLIAAGARIDQADATGVTPAYYAAERGNLDAVGVLVEAGYDIDKKFTWFDKTNGMDMRDCTMLTVAVAKNHKPAVRYLLEKGADCTIGTEGTFFSGNCLGKVNFKYPLYFAVETGDLELVKLLVEKGNISTIKFSWQDFEYKPKGKNCTGGGKFVRAQLYAKALGLTEIEKYLKEVKL